MTTPEQNAANDQDAQELTDESLDEVSGGVNLIPLATGAVTPPAAVAYLGAKEGTGPTPMF